jgi:cytochrome c
MNISMKINNLPKTLCFLLFISVSAFAQAPDESRFNKVIITEGLDEPMEMTILKDKRVLFVERKGNLKLYDPESGAIKTIATIPVNTKYTNREGKVREAEEGLMGIIHDPQFEQNHWIYMYYADPATPKHILARWELKGEELVESSKKILLEVPTQREECCHTGGGMVFDKSGNLYLTVGNNTSNSNSDGYAPIDERPGQEVWDDQRGASNTNDLRGKILRIKPLPDGTYSIPSGNLFPKGTPQTKPEIYTMGHRNPWRPTIDSKTGYLYWGEVGPDASVDSEKGPRGYDEFNQAKGPGNFGWPYFIGDNKAYADWDFTTSKLKSEARFNPEKPINDSPNNTGLKELPPAQKAFVWYPYGISEEFPLVGSSGRSATGGPVFRAADYPAAERPFPSYYEGKWLMVEFMRGWIMSVTMDEKGDYKSMERFLPNESFGSAIDMDFGPDGDLYVLEYGSAWFKGNDNARLVKVQYNSGNRKPVVKLTADKNSGALPLTVKLSGEGSTDPDGDVLTYKWEITDEKGAAKKLTGKNVSNVFVKPGVYTVELTVKDIKGEESFQSVEIKAGNESPQVSFNLDNGNKSFYFPGKPLNYTVNVSDREDGDLKSGKIKPEEVAVSIDYLPAGFDKIEVSQSHRGTDALAFASTGLRLIDQSDCKSCHQMKEKSVGPSYMDVAAKYKGDKRALDRLSQKVIKGGMGVWGEHAMSAHPQLSKAEATSMVEYILNIGDESAFKTMPVKGTYEPKLPEQLKSEGVIFLRAAYRDKGSKTMKSLTSEEIRILRSPVVNPENADYKKSMNQVITPSRSLFAVGQNAHLGFKKIDFTDIKSIEMLVQVTSRVGAAGGEIEIRLDSPEGKLIGKTPFVALKDVSFTPPPPAKPAAPGAAPAPAPAQPDMAAMRRRMSQSLSINVAEAGIHDVYFVYKNPKAEKNQIQMQVQEIQFRDKEINQ